jgi:hypothetical protein
MTVIAYKDGVMAADSLASADGQRKGLYEKIAKNSRGELAGVAGYCSEAQRFLTVFCFGSHKDLMAFKFEEKQVEAIVVLPEDARILCFDSSGKHLYNPFDSFEATGSAQALAIGAMAMGASAIEAAEVGIKYAVSCGGPVRFVHLDSVPCPDYPGLVEQAELCPAEAA